MATYCFACRECGERFSLPVNDAGETTCPACGKCCIARDYRAEAVGVGSGVRVSRDGTVQDQARLMLPTNNDFRGPGDPDGTKGMRAWHDRFQPAADNPRPVKVGEIDKRVF